MSHFGPTRNLPTGRAGAGFNARGSCGGRRVQGLGYGFRLTRPLTTMGFWHSFRVSGPGLGCGGGWGGGADDVHSTVVVSSSTTTSTTDHRRHRPRRRKHHHHHQHHDVPVQCSEAARELSRLADSKNKDYKK